MSYLKLDDEVIWETDYLNLTVTYGDKVAEFETVEEMDQWVEDNLVQEEG